MTKRFRIVAPGIVGLFLSTCIAFSALARGSSDYDELLVLFADWREFEAPPLLDGAPDYSKEQFAVRREEFVGLQERLLAFEINDWPVAQQVDWHIVRAEMNGYDFNERILIPWARSTRMRMT